jgi:hypothetical protein
MKFICCLFIVLSVLACSTAKNMAQENDAVEEPRTSEVAAEDANVKVMLSSHFPDCGGMTPTEEMLNRSAPYAETVNLIDLSDGSKTKYTPNAQGVLFLKLPVGNYALQELYKDVPYADFISKNAAQGAYVEPGTDECYNGWWKSYIVKFEITEEVPSIDVKGYFSQRCFVGNDPCSYYNGPIPL